MLDRMVRAALEVMAKRKDIEAIAFVAVLASGRTCLSFDNEGAARLTFELSQPEAAKLAARLPELTDTSIAVVCKPFNG